MDYVAENIANKLKAAREKKGLSQRALSEKAGVPQSHISKIENGAVDLRLSSLVELARVLDLELMLVPRKFVSAVQSIVRNRNNQLPEAESMREAQKELARIQKTIKSLPKTSSALKEVNQLRRQVQEMQRLKYSVPNIEGLQTARKALREFRNNTKNIEALRNAVSEFHNMRNALVHMGSQPESVESQRPAYSLDDEKDNENG